MTSPKVVVIGEYCGWIIASDLEADIEQGLGPGESQPQPNLLDRASKSKF